jgi:cytochrome c-type biogenesis protein
MYIMELSLGLIISSFIAGVFTFFAPCTLPLVPAFLGVISGVGPQQLTDPSEVKKIRWRIFVNAVFYVIGFSAIFILFGVAFSYLGQIFVIRELIQKIGGILIIFFGLFLMGVFNFGWLSREHQIRAPRLLQRTSKFNSLAVGVLFALGWSPCIGPLLGTILLLATGTGTVATGTLLLVVFSAGLALPFLITALLIGRAFSSFGKWDRTLKVINIVAGIFLIVLGVLLVTGQFEAVLGIFRQYLLRFDFYEDFVNKFL